MPAMSPEVVEVVGGGGLTSAVTILFWQLQRCQAGRRNDLRQFVNSSLRMHGVMDDSHSLLKEEVDDEVA